MSLPIDVPITFGDLPIFSTFQTVIEYWNALPIWQQVLIGGVLGFIGLTALIEVI